VLKLARVPFDEQALENDFRRLVDFLCQAESHYFLFRDFQSANIIVKDEQPWFIDYQGGRRGALPYDPASLLYDAKAKLSRTARKALTAHYLETLSQALPEAVPNFTPYYEGFIWIRLMQAMGAFCFRGVIEKKPGFTESIPPALDLMEELFQDWSLPIEVPMLKNSLAHLITSEYLMALVKEGIPTGK
jgi:aminoglycoside/choline kinase family phosphotransferase